jgi:hydrogenase maturation factor
MDVFSAPAEHLHLRGTQPVFNFSVFLLTGDFSIEKYSDCWKGRKEKCETTSCSLVV